MNDKANDPVAVPIEWGAVRALAMVVGVREAARRMLLSEEQVKKRCTREGWLNSPEARACNKMAISNRSCTTPPVSPQGSPLSPANLILSEISALGQKTRLSIARGMAKAGQHIETMDGDALLERSGDVKNVAQTADLVHGWKDAAPQVKIRLDLLGAAPEGQIIDIEATTGNVDAADAMPLDDWDSTDALDY